MKKISILLILTLTMVACDFGGEDPVFDYNKKSAELIETNNSFGLNLFGEIVANEDEANVMISPASISLALGMAYNGAESTTKEEFEALLNYEGLSRDEVNEITRDLITALVIDSKDNILEIANSIWYDEGFPIYQAFIDINNTYFDAEVNEKDFSKTSTVDDINKWVKDKTHDKIEKIIEELSPDSRLVLINALYFNCIWRTEFDPDETKSEMFYNEDQSEFGTVEMMTTEANFNYALSDNFSAVELPYKDGKFSMHLILPAIGTSVEELISDLDGDKWISWIDLYEEYEEVQVTMPKFKFDYERKLRPDLIEMGMTEAFGNTADFSSISEVDLFISKIIHKTYIDVNEEGTEAAAVTGIVFDVTSVGPGDDKINMRIDRPFLFAITEESSKSIVFIGKLSEPEYEQ